MKAMILAAGLGTRLRPLTDRLPKPLLPVGKLPLIHYILFLLRHYGITDVVINLHHMGEMIRERLEDGRALGMRITYSEEATILGTGGGLKKAEWFLKDGNFILINADILVDLNLDEVLSFHRRRGAVATLVLRRDPEADRYGIIETDDQERIRRFLGEPEEVTGSLRPLMFTGVQVLEPTIFQRLPEGVFHPITDTYREMVRNGEGLFGYETKGYWLDLGTQDRYERAQEDHRQGRVRFHFLPSD